MDLTWTLVFVVGLTTLTVLLTGPGLWSERWGWRWFEKRARPDRRDP
jgi:hypothetical protein